MRKKSPTAALLLLIVPLTILASRFLLQQDKLYERSSGPDMNMVTASSSRTWRPSSLVIGTSWSHPGASIGSSSGRKLFLAAGSRELQAHRRHHRLRRSQLTRPTQPPPPTTLNSHEIDPRYGVEKRLVPSGPNPLHN